MVILTIDNSYSRITGLPPKLEKELREHLSYTVGSYHSRFGPKKKSMLDKKGYFATGLMHRVDAWISKHPGLAFQEIDNRAELRSKPGLAKPNLILYPWQMDATARTFYKERGVLIAPTGTGKSRAIRSVCYQHGIATLVVVPSLELRTQLSETLKDLPWVTVENIDSPRLKKYTEFDMLIIDEAHHGSAATYQRLNKAVWTKIYRRYGFTATGFRNDPEETMLLEAICGPTIFKLTYKEAIAAKYIVPVEAYTLECPKKKTNAYTYREVYNELIINNEDRNLTISVLLARLNAAGTPTLCLVREIAHGNILSQMTGLPFVSGADDESRDYIRQFNAGEIKALIGTTGVLGEGIDTKPAEYVIIAGGGKAKSQFMQACGRGLRNYPGKESAKVIIFKDSSHKFLLRHYRTQCVTLKEEYGIVPTKIDV